MKPIESKLSVTRKSEDKQKAERSPTISTKSSPRVQQVEKEFMPKQSIEDYEISSEAPDESKLKGWKRTSLPTSVEISNDKQLQEFIDFVKEPANRSILKYVKSIKISEITDSNVMKARELLNLICDKASPMHKLASLHIGSIQGKAVVNLGPLPDSVTSLLINEVHHAATLNFPNNFSSSKLKSLVLGDINARNINYLGNLPSGLEVLKINFMNLSVLDQLIFNEGLKEFSFGHVYSEQQYLTEQQYLLPGLDLRNLPETVTSISIKSVQSGSVYFPNSMPQKLILLSIGNIKGGRVIGRVICFPKTPLVCSKFTIGDVEKGIHIKNFPINLVLLPTFSCGKIGDSELKVKIDEKQKSKEAAALLLGYKAHRAAEAEKRDQEKS